MTKRLIDIAGSALGLVLLAPVLAILVIAIRLTSTGPGIFSQVRVGRHGLPFRCLKLRTMYQNSPVVPTHQSSASAVTPLGRFLRRTRLDEIPQLYNVLRGEMTFVGPRPCLPSQVELIEERKRRGVLEVRPGITGLAQIRGIDMSDPARLGEVDAEYVASATVTGDLRIMLETVGGVARHRDHIGK